MAHISPDQSGLRGSQPGPCASFSRRVGHCDLYNPVSVVEGGIEPATSFSLLKAVDSGKSRRLSGAPGFPRSWLYLELPMLVTEGGERETRSSTDKQLIGDIGATAHSAILRGTRRQNLCSRECSNGSDFLRLAPNHCGPYSLVRRTERAEAYSGERA